MLDFWIKTLHTDPRSATSFNMTGPEPRMRPLLSSIAAAALLIGTVANGPAWADVCTKPVEHTAFNVTGLKSQLMVTAISCQASDKYNKFILRYRSALVAQEATLNSYFRRAFGSRWQTMHDDYITALANSQSEVGIQSGTLFCDRTIGLFDEVLALKDGTELQGYAANKVLTQPIVLVDCPAPGVKATRTAKK
jgi:hypothetical protein